MHGQFVWYELMTPDTGAARKFYTPLASWGTQPFDENYLMFTTGDAPFAGLSRLTPEQQQQGVPPNWLPYVESSDVDATTRQATSLGGQVIVPPQDIPDVGRFAVLRDPQGAVFGIYRSDRPGGAWDGTPVLGRFSWHELMTTDRRRALEFYRQLFGWERTDEMDMGGGNSYVMYGKGQPYGGIFDRPAEMASVPPFWLCYILVKDVERAVAAATKSGARLQRGPMDIPGGRIAILSDPQGAAFAVHDLRPSAPASAPAAKTAGSTTRKQPAKKRSTARSASAGKESGARKPSAGSKRPATKKRSSSTKRSRTAKGSSAAKRSAGSKRSAAKKSARARKRKRRG